MSALLLGLTSLQHLGEKQLGVLMRGRCRQCVAPRNNLFLEMSGMWVVRGSRTFVRRSDRRLMAASLQRRPGVSEPGKLFGAGAHTDFGEIRSSIAHSAYSMHIRWAESTHDHAVPFKGASLSQHP